MNHEQLRVSDIKSPMICSVDNQHKVAGYAWETVNYSTGILPFLFFPALLLDIDDAENASFLLR